MKERVMQFRAAATVFKLLPFIQQERRRLLFAALLTLLLTTIEVAAPLLVGVFVDSILRQAGGTTAPLSPSTQRIIILVLIVAALLRGFLIARQGALTGKIGERVAARLRNTLWQHLLRVPLDYVQRRGAGRLLLRFTGDTRSVQRVVTQGLIRLSQDAVLGFAVLIALCWLNWRMALAVAVILPFYGAIFARVNPQLRKESRAARRGRSRISAYLDEHIAGMKVIKACVRQGTEAEHLRGLTRRLAKRGTRLATVSGTLQGLSATTIAGSGALVLALAAGEVAAGRLTGGRLVAFYTLLGLLVPVLQRIVVANRHFQEAYISVERLAETLAVPPETQTVLDTRPAINVTQGTISVENVSFVYEDGTRALQDVSLTARRGEIVALVGSNGAGKSTLLELLLCFCVPTRGRITVDEQDTAHVSLDSLRAQIGLVTQQVALFNGTIAESIAYGASDEDQQQRQVEQAARLAGVLNLVENTPEGWEARIGEAGRALSGGQRQRLALARALASDPPILVLDEATSALDGETEQDLAEMLRQLAPEKTIIVTAHRVATVKVATRIYVLDDGRICEHGTHRQLMRSGGVYARLFAEQEEEELLETAVA